MVDKNRFDHLGGSGEAGEPSFNDVQDFEAVHRLFRIEQIASAHAALGRAFDLDKSLGSESGISKKFVVASQGDASTNDLGYPFANFRVKLRPKSGVASPIRVAALRFQTVGPAAPGAQIILEHVYIAWERVDASEHSFVLDVDAFSRLDLPMAFPGDAHAWPAVKARTAAEAEDLINLTQILDQFEPDLQTRASSVKV